MFCRMSDMVRRYAMNMSFLIPLVGIIVALASLYTLTSPTQCTHTSSPIRLLNTEDHASLVASHLQGIVSLAA